MSSHLCDRSRLGRWTGSATLFLLLVLSRRAYRLGLICHLLLNLTLRQRYGFALCLAFVSEMIQRHVIIETLVHDSPSAEQHIGTSGIVTAGCDCTSRVIFFQMKIK